MMRKLISAITLVAAALVLSPASILAQPPPLEQSDDGSSHEQLEKALRVALADEYKARATYRKVIEVYGEVRPFSNIVEAEDRHIAALKARFAAHGISVPEDDWETRVKAPGSLVAACQAAIEAETANAALYDRLLAETVDYPDVQKVFSRLQTASRDRHLPAFQKCLRKRGGKRGDGSSQ